MGWTTRWEIRLSLGQNFMTANSPNHCRPEALALLEAQLPTIETTESLVLGAIAISMHALDDVEPKTILRQLDDLAARVASRFQSDHPRVALAHLHQVLFEEEGFKGNRADYYSPLNSYLPAVLVSKSGIPITLSLIYKAVAERIGLSVEGVNAPGHFLVRVQADDDTMLVDAFADGQVLTPDEARDRIAQIVGGNLPDEATALPSATHRQWLGRMLANLQGIFSQTKRAEDLAAMLELRALL